jgi:hypothetical protein
MTIIYDMANGSIQPGSTPEIGSPDRSAGTSPATELRLAQIGVPEKTAEPIGPEASYHVIRGLLLSK